MDIVRTSANGWLLGFLHIRSTNDAEYLRFGGELYELIIENEIHVLSQTFEVAWCTKQRNNARLIPDGTITGVSFIKTGSNKYSYTQVFFSLTIFQTPTFKSMATAILHD
jgi:hypothetical protein